MSKPLISIVICCYNRAHLLSRTIASALAQTYEPAEIIVLDDGSTDNTPAVISQYAESVRYFRQENCGIAVARTNACRLARGEYIAFLDDDDLMPPDRLEVLYDALHRYPQAVFAVGELATIDKDDNVLELPTPRERDQVAEKLYEDGFEAVLWPFVPAAPHTTLFRRSDGEQIDWFDARYKYAAEDKDFFARLGRLGPVIFVPHVVSLYRRGHESLTLNQLRTTLTQLTLFSNALEITGNTNPKLRKRLQLRMRLGLQSVARLVCREEFSKAELPAQDLRRFILELSAREFVLYRLFQVKLLIKNILLNLVPQLRTAS